MKKYLFLALLVLSAIVSIIGMSVDSNYLRESDTTSENMIILDKWISITPRLYSATKSYWVKVQGEQTGNMIEIPISYKTYEKNEIGDYLEVDYKIIPYKQDNLKFKVIDYH